MAFTKFELLTSPSFEKIRILSILILTTQRDPRKFTAFTTVPVLAFPSSYLKVPNMKNVTYLFRSARDSDKTDLYPKNVDKNFFDPTRNVDKLNIGVWPTDAPRAMNPERRVDWIQVCFLPANFRFNMAELMADSTEISSQNEENSVVQDEDQRARLTQFPQTRVRNMMKIDPDLHLANRESVFLLTRAAVSQGFIDTILADSKFIL